MPNLADENLEAVALAEEDDLIPIVGFHRGIGLHDQQSEERLAIVRADIDSAFALTDGESLASFAADPARAPEARLAAAARAKAAWRIDGIREGRNVRLLEAHVVGLDSQSWRDPNAYGTIFGRDASGTVRREMAITDG